MARRLPSQPPVLPGFSYVHVLGSGGFADLQHHEIAAGVQPHQERCQLLQALQIFPVGALGAGLQAFGAGDARQMVMNDQSGGKNRMIICTDRIAAAAAQGAEMAANSADIERNAYRSALSGLQNARAKVASDPHMGNAERAEAISSIEKSSMR